MGESSIPLTEHRFLAVDVGRGFLGPVAGGTGTESRG